MRRLEFTTLVDPFHVRFGEHWAAVLLLPALLGELFWSAELLVALGRTLEVLLGMEFASGVLLSAVVVTGYTMLGGMWAVAYTDVFQLGLIPLGLLAALPFVMGNVGGLEACIGDYWTHKQAAATPIPSPALGGVDGYWSTGKALAWWDLTLMLVLGGIPWNCYFQRVLSCRSPDDARNHSILAGLLTMLLTVPPVLIGMAVYLHAWGPDVAGDLAKNPSLALPLAFKVMTPVLVGLLGLAAITGAVTSSYSSSILSAGSMLSWNVYKALIHQGVRAEGFQRVLRGSVVMLGAASLVLALRVQSVQQLWFLTSDLVYVLLFPQLLWTLFDPKANRIGSMSAFAVSLTLRLGGGEPLLGLPPFLPYDRWFDALGLRQAAGATGEEAFPYKWLAMSVGLVLLPVVSRLTARWSSPRPLQRLAASNP
jgi:high affinity choline transporter 7